MDHFLKRKFLIKLQINIWSKWSIYSKKPTKKTMCLLMCPTFLVKMDILFVNVDILVKNLLKTLDSYNVMIWMMRWSMAIGWNKWLITFT
jgi:hypothetical protein